MNDVRPKILTLFPGVAMFFDPGGIVKRVTSFGSQKSIDVEIYGYDLEKARGVIRQVEGLMHQTAGLADIEVSREENYPELDINVDREKAALLGISETECRQCRPLLTERQWTDRPDYLSPIRPTGTSITSARGLTRSTAKT